MMKVLVTGITGFLGKYVAECLLQNGCEIIAAVRNPAIGEKYLHGRNIEWKHFDLSNIQNNQNYYAYFGKPDVLIHLAWEGLPNYKATFHISENLPRHTSFISNLIEHGLRNLTVTGTCLEYGLQEGELTESMNVTPVVPYAVAKNELRKALEKECEIYSADLKWLRLFYMWGAGQA